MSKQGPPPSGLEPRSFGTTARGEAATLYTLTNANGLVARVTDFGATLTELHLPDRAGKTADVVLGFDDVSGYESGQNPYFGCTVGRVANRIAGACFTLNGERHELAANEAPHHLHGGERGFGQRSWKAKLLGGASLRLRHDSPDGEEGYPGALSVEVVYTLTDEDELQIDYRASADANTPVNLTNHSYFNLAGAGSSTILDHRLQVDAEGYTPCDDALIPTGVLASVADTPLDFRSEQRVGARIEQLTSTAAHGYDHNYVLDGRAGELRRAGRLSETSSGRALEIFTTLPCMQLYTGNHLSGQRGKGGAAYARRGALCLETQHFPNAVNQPSFPSILLRPGATDAQATVYRFSAS